MLRLATELSHKNGIEISACNSILADAFGNLCGKGAENKHIPLFSTPTQI